MQITNKTLACAVILLGTFTCNLQLCLVLTGVASSCNLKHRPSTAINGESTFLVPKTGGSGFLGVSSKDYFMLDLC